MSATAEQTKPKDLEVGAYVRIDGLEGEVSKNDKKGGRLTIADNEGGHAVVRYRDIVEAEIIQPDDAGIDEATTPTMPTPTFPTPAQLQAERQAAEDRKKTSRPSKAGGRPKYPEEITDAVRRAKAARGTTNGAPGAKQHVHAREVVGRIYPVDDPQMGVEAILAAAFSGVETKGSLKKLRAIADGTAPKADLQALRPLAQQMSDPFCKGRNLASILVAWIEQAQTADDVAKVKAAR